MLQMTEQKLYKYKYTPSAAQVKYITPIGTYDKYMEYSCCDLQQLLLGRAIAQSPGS
jgi:hypothetical protein